MATGQHLPANNSGPSAPLRVIVSNTRTSVKKCTSATTNERRVAPACNTYASAVAGRLVTLALVAKAFTQLTIDLFDAGVLGAYQAERTCQHCPCRKRSAIQVRYCSGTVAPQSWPCHDTLHIQGNARERPRDNNGSDTSP